METDELKEKVNLKEKVGDLTSHLTEYLDTYYRLIILKAGQKATNISSAVFSTVIICTIGFLILFFAGFAGAWWLGDVIGSRAGGFLIVAGVFLLLVVVLVLLRRSIVFPFIRNSIIREVYE
jgi:apolipoprotein N-acyltransferase